MVTVQRDLQIKVCGSQDAPPGETGLYLTVKTGQVVDGEIPGCIENVIRPSMEADHPKWRAYVEQKAKEFYENPENQ